MRNDSNSDAGSVISSHASIFKQDTSTVATPFTSDAAKGVGR